MKHWKTTAATMALALCATSAVADTTMVHDKDFWRDAIDAMAAEAGFEHTGYTTDQYKAFLQSSMSAGNPPDIYTWWTGNALADIVSSGQAAAIDELWDAKIAAGEFAPGTRDLFSVDGKTYAIPMLIARWVVFYNKDIFAENGVEVPTTWEELEAAAATFAANGVTPFTASVQDGWRGFIWFSEIMIRQNPDAYAGLHDGSVPYDGPEVQAVFDQWLEWYDKGYFTDPRSNDEQKDFAGGSSAMYIQGEWAVGGLTGYGMEVGEDLGAFIMPNADPDLPNQVIVEGAPILISPAAWADPEKRAAYEYWASVEGTKTWADAVSLFTGNLKGSAPNAIIEGISAEISEGGHIARNRWWEAVPSDIQGDLVAELSAFMLEPTAEKAAEVMANMQSFNADYWANR